MTTMYVCMYVCMYITVNVLSKINKFNKMPFKNRTLKWLYIVPMSTMKHNKCTHNRYLTNKQSHQKETQNGLLGLTLI